MSDYLAQFRANNATIFTETGLPKNNAEEWRYTRLSALEKQTSSFITSHNKDITNEQLAEYSLINAWTLVFINGQFCAELSAQLPDSVQLTVLSSASDAQLTPYLNQTIDTENQHGFITFNNANFTDGLILTIAENTILNQPIQLLYLVTESQALSAIRNLIVLNQSAQVELIETFIGVDSLSYLTANVNEIFLAEKAHLTTYKVQCESESAYHFAGNYTQQAKQSYFTQHTIQLGALLSRHDSHNHLKDSAECTLNGLTVIAKKQHCDNHTRIIHAEPNAISNEYYKSIADNRARAVFQGRIIVAENAQKTSSKMNNRNLLLSADAEIDTKPQLEIYADNVQCSHGVTVGQLQEQSLFYLQSRGLDLESARQLLIFAFANEMVDLINHEELKTFLIKQLVSRFSSFQFDYALQ